MFFPVSNETFCVVCHYSSEKYDRKKVGKRSNIFNCVSSKAFLKILRIKVFGEVFKLPSRRRKKMFSRLPELTLFSYS